MFREIFVCPGEIITVDKAMCRFFGSILDWRINIVKLYVLVLFLYLIVHPAMFWRKLLSLKYILFIFWSGSLSNDLEREGLSEY